MQLQTVAHDEHPESESLHFLCETQNLSFSVWISMGLGLLDWLDRGVDGALSMFMSIVASTGSSLEVVVIVRISERKTTIGVTSLRSVYCKFLLGNLVQSTVLNCLTVVPRFKTLIPNS